MELNFIAICGMSDEYELAHVVAYLEVNPETWFQWPEKKRSEYARKFNELSIEDAIKKKPTVSTTARTPKLCLNSANKQTMPIFSLYH